ncbi:MAG TPA: thioesterase family protein [Caulobacteraceae bacterium]|jgi:4-hydroxybenzoyl-CoA thioesterase
MTNPVFTTPITVRFKHCDPAGIAFYPRLFEFANDTVEAWFAAMGVGFPELIGERGLGVPTVSAKAQFLKPCRYGETLEGQLRPTILGERSMDLRLVLAGREGEARAEFDITLVCVDKAAVIARPWPEDVRVAVQAWLAREDVVGAGG